MAIISFFFFLFRMILIFYPSKFFVALMCREGTETKQNFRGVSDEVGKNEKKKKWKKSYRLYIHRRWGGGRVMNVLLKLESVEAYYRV